MDINCFIILLVNAIAYIALFIVYQCKKKRFDIGSILLLTWVIGSSGAAYYYTFEIPYLSYTNITVAPLIFLFIINCLLFSPFLKLDYNRVKQIETYNLGQILNIISIFFAVINIIPLINCIFKLTSFSFIGSALADMYNADEDRANLIFSSFARPFFSVIRHFRIFIIFLFFYQLTKRDYNKLIIAGLAANIITFALVTLLSGSRGGIMSLLMTCAYFLFLMKNAIRPTIVKKLMRFATILLACLILGVGAISISRLSTSNLNKSYDNMMDQWISQYAGEGIIQYDDIIWHLDKHLDGKQNLPYPYSFIDKSLKNLDQFSAEAQSKLQTPVTIFYTYLGDLIIDFGILGSAIAAILIYLLIKYLIKIKKGKISFYHLIILSFFYIYLSIGFTANIYRTYFTQLQIVETLVLLGILYTFQKLTERKQ